MEGDASCGQSAGGKMTSPDQNATGFLDRPPDYLRYENQSRDPDDVGMKLASLIRPKSRILDVGCGTGSITELIERETGASIVGIEPDPERVAVARERGLNVVEGILSLEFLEQFGPFETILFADVLEHLPNPGEQILLAKAGLAADGSILASVPNIAHWFTRVNLLRGRFVYRDCGIMDATHLRWFTRDTLHKFFENLGFRVTDHLYTVNTGMIDYYQSIPWKWLPIDIRYWVIRRLARRFPTLFGCQHVVKAVPR
jgi:methionine biosynthesis protein MetW